MTPRLAIAVLALALLAVLSAQAAAKAWTSPLADVDAREANVRLALKLSLSLSRGEDGVKRVDVDVVVQPPPPQDEPKGFGAFPDLPTFDPKPVWDGRFFFTGARVTILPRHAENLRPQAVVHVFALTKALFAHESAHHRFVRMKEFPDVAAPDSWQLPAPLPDKLRNTLLHPSELEALPLECHFPTTTTTNDVEATPLRLIRSMHPDVVAGDTTHVWECALPPSLSTRASLDALYEHAMPLHVRVRLPPTTTTEPPELVAFDIPLHSGVTGMAGPDNAPGRPPPWRSPGVANVTLCTGGVTHHALDLLVPWIRFHLDALHIDHIVVGIQHARHSSSFTEMRAALEDVIMQGRVVVMPTHLDGIDVERDSLKMQFLNTCLYHAKQTSEYVAVWDIDEFFFPAPGLPLSFPDLVRAKDAEFTKQAQDGNPTACATWCYAAIASFTTAASGPTEKWDESMRQGYLTMRKSKLAHPYYAAVPAVYPFRFRKHNWVWTKGVARSSRVYFAGFHNFGTCCGALRPFPSTTKKNRTAALSAFPSSIAGTNPDDDARLGVRFRPELRQCHLPYANEAKTCALRTSPETFGAMRHHLEIFYANAHDDNKVFDVVPDELAEFSMKNPELFGGRPLDRRMRRALARAWRSFRAV